jgi:hypothetical protein
MPPFCRAALAAVFCLSPRTGAISVTAIRGFQPDKEIQIASLVSQPGKKTYEG